MTVTQLQPDQPLSSDTFPVRSVAAAPDAAPFGDLVRRLLGATGGSLDRADDAERAFIDGRGGLQEMMITRGKADVLLSVAATAASRTAQAISTILGMQV